MNESQTFESILERMLARIPSEMDKREGSIIYDALAPSAAELAQAYISMNSLNDLVSVDTTTGYELTELAYQNGVFRKNATKAIRKGVFNINISIGSRFSSESNTFIALEKITNFEYKMECEQPGAQGNIYSGDLVPIEYIDGLTISKLTDVIVAGVEEETDEQLRERYRRRVVEPAQDGNTAQYKEWAEAYDGIGISKVFPLWNGGNTVKVAITNRSYQVADSTLVNSFQNYLDPGGTGLGNGVAPIGAKVTVSGGITKEINISGNIVLADGYTDPSGVAESISNYLASITFQKDSVSYMRTAVTILDNESVADLNSFTINGGIIDIPLVGEEIPLINSINLTVVSG